MTAFLHTLLNMSLTASFVAVIVFLLRLILKGRAARQTVCLLWLLVFARLLIPVTLQSPVSLVPDLELSDPAPVVSTAPEAVPTLPGNTSPIATIPPNVSAPAVTFPVQNPVVTIPPNVSAPAPMVSAPVAEPPVTEEPAPFPWETVLTAVWAVGVAAMLTYGLGSYLSIRRKLRFAIRSREGFWEDPHLRSPFILGLVRPKIYLPCHMTPYARRFILCHEQAHIRRGDHIVKPICWLALAIHWFNPLAWAAFLLLSRDIEVACDEKVLRELGQEVKADYSATLLALATNGRFPAPTPLSFGEGDAKTRIKSVLNFKKPALWVTVAAIVVAIVAAVCLLTDPVDKFDPEGYTTLDEYPGLYFERTVVEETGETTVMAYKLENNKPVPVAGWQDLPADNLATLIHPDGEKEVLLASQWEISYRYEQYLVDYMMAQDESWAQRYIEEADDLITMFSVSLADLQSSGQIGDLGTFQGGIAYTPEENLLFCWEGTAQVLPRWTQYSANAHTVKVYSYDRAEDGTDRLDILWTGKDVTLAVSSVPGGLQTYTGDALITYLWDGKTWTAHNAADTIAFTDKPVSFDAEDRIITVTYDPNAHTNGNPDIAHIDPGMIPRQFSIPEELGQIERVYVGEAARIARREDGDYDLTYGVYAVLEGGDPVRMADVTAIMKWNALTEQFEITFTGAEPAADPVYTAIPDDAETLADIRIASLHMLEPGTVLFRYGDEIVELKDFGYNPMRPACQMWATDIDGDGVNQIHIIHQFGSGTGVSIDKLTTVTPTDRGLEVSYHDWSGQELDFEQNNSFFYYPESNSISLTCGSEQLWLRLSDYFKDLDWDAYGSEAIVATVAHYSLNPDGTINLAFAPALSDGSPMVHYLPMTVNYTLKYQNGAFRQVDNCVLKADEEGMLVQPFTVTMPEAAIYNGVCRRFELTLDGKTVTFEGTHMTSRDILTYYIDVNGDGVADPVVFLTPGEGGTGSINHEIHVVDGATLKENPNLKYTVWLYAELAYTFTADEDNFYITAEGLDIVLPKADILAYWADYPAYADIHFLEAVEFGDSRITVKDGMLCVISQCMVGDNWQYYGQLETYLMTDGWYPSVVKTVYVTPDGQEITNNRFSSLLGGLDLPDEIVTGETLPTDPEQYYLVAELNGYALYARNHGWGDVLLTYGNIFQRYSHPSHTGHMNLPRLTELDSETLAVISEVNTGTGVGVDELVVYRSAQHLQDSGAYTLGWDDYLYDWRSVAEELNRNNTLTYDKETNSLTLSWKGQTYNSGKLAEDLSVGYDLEDGFTGALIAVGDIIRIIPNGDGTFTIRMDTSIARGNKGAFSEYEASWFWYRSDDDSYVYPLSTGITGLDLVWTVRFTGSGFEVVTPPTIYTPSPVPEGASLEMSFPEAGLYIYTPAGDGSEQLVVYKGQAQRFPRFGDEIVGLQLADMDGDGHTEILITARSLFLRDEVLMLTMLDTDEPQWKDLRETTPLKAAFPEESLYLFAVNGDGGKTYRLVDQGQTYTVDGLGILGDLTWETRLADLDGDGAQELIVLGAHYAGNGGHPLLNVFDKGEDGWSLHRFASYESTQTPDYRSLFGDKTMAEAAVFTPDPDDPTRVTLSLGGFTKTFTVSEEVAGRDGSYALWESYPIIYWQDGSYWLLLTGDLHRGSSSFSMGQDNSVGIRFHYLSRLDYNADGTFTPTPTSLSAQWEQTYFKALMGPSYSTWYHGAITTPFDSPEEMDLSQVFYTGFGAQSLSWSELTGAEQAALTGAGFPKTMPIQKRPAKQLDEALQRFFGVTLYDVTIPESWAYCAATDCYYSSHSDVNWVTPLTVTEVRQQNGLYHVCYEVNELWGEMLGSTQMVLTLRDSGDRFTVIANRTLEGRLAATDSTAEDVFLAALNGELEFTQYGESEQGTLSDFLSFADPPLSISAMALVDMDGDGTRELLLRLNLPSIVYGTEILRYDPAAGTLTGYMLWYRAMYDLNADGTFEFSGSSVDVGIARLSFTENGYAVEKLIYTEGSNTTNEVYFYAHGQSVTEAAYQKARYAHLGQTEPVVWLDYTPENIKQLLVPG